MALSDQIKVPAQVKGAVGGGGGSFGGMLFEATKKSGQTTSAAGTARLTWDAASRNDGHLTVSGTDNVTMTAVQTGVYAVTYTFFGTGNSGVIVYKNGSVFAIGLLQDAGSYPNISCLVPLAAGDTIEIYLYTASALTIDVSLAQARVLRIARIV